MVTGPRSVLQLGYTESWVSVLRRGDSFRLGIREDFREEAEPWRMNCNYLGMDGYKLV